MFSNVPCKGSKLSASGMAEWHLRPDPGTDAVARQPGGRTEVPVVDGQPGGILPKPAGEPSRGRKHCCAGTTAGKRTCGPASLRVPMGEYGTSPAPDAA